MRINKIWFSANPKKNMVEPGADASCKGAGEHESNPLHSTVNELKYSSELSVN